MKKYNFHCDPGHGWLEVDVLDLHSIGLTPEMFSSFSYQQGSTCYLEEDCDMSLFCAAYKARHGRYPDVVRIYKNKSPIRSLPSMPGTDYSWEKTLERVKSFSLNPHTT